MIIVLIHNYKYTNYTNTNTCTTHSTIIKHKHQYFVRFAGTIITFILHIIAVSPVKLSVSMGNFTDQVVHPSCDDHENFVFFFHWRNRLRYDLVPLYDSYLMPHRAYKDSDSTAFVMQAAGRYRCFVSISAISTKGKVHARYKLLHVSCVYIINVVRVRWCLTCRNYLASRDMTWYKKW